MITQSRKIALLAASAFTAASLFAAPASAASIVLGEFDTRGECEEAAAHEVNRVRGFEIFGPGQRDDVNRRAHAALTCEELGDVWLLIREV